MHVVKVTWNSQTANWWNESCALIIEYFGLPGHRYTTEVSVDYMKFFFRSAEDKLMCAILLSDRL